MLRNFLKGLAQVYCFIGVMAGMVFIKPFLYFSIGAGAFWNAGIATSVIGMLLTYIRFMIRALCWPFGGFLIAINELTIDQWIFDYWDKPVNLAKSSARWYFSADMNMSGTVTLGDVWLWVKWLYFYPGDYLIQFLIDYFPKDAQFLELTTGNLGGLLSGVMSSIIYGPIILVILAILFRIYMDRKWP